MRYRVQNKEDSVRHSRPEYLTTPRKQTHGGRESGSIKPTYLHCTSDDLKRSRNKTKFEVLTTCKCEPLPAYRLGQCCLLVLRVESKDITILNEDIMSVNVCMEGNRFFRGRRSTQSDMLHKLPLQPQCGTADHPLDWRRAASWR